MDLIIYFPPSQLAMYTFMWSARILILRALKTKNIGILLIQNTS